MSHEAMSLAFVGGIIEREQEGRKQLLIQTRFHNLGNTFYNGTFEFAAGRLDKPFENVYDVLAREIKEETGLTLKSMIGDSRTGTFRPRETDASFGFRPFCCVQQLKEGRPWVGFIFRCQVEDGDPVDQDGESKDVHWVDASKVKKMFQENPEKLFTLELPAWKYYFDEVEV